MKTSGVQASLACGCESMYHTAKEFSGVLISFSRDVPTSRMSGASHA